MIIAFATFGRERVIMRKAFTALRTMNRATTLTVPPAGLIRPLTDPLRTLTEKTS